MYMIYTTDRDRSRYTRYGFLCSTCYFLYMLYLGPRGEYSSRKQRAEFRGESDGLADGWLPGFTLATRCNVQAQGTMAGGILHAPSHHLIV